MYSNLISIIMPVYNTGEILRNTIESILAQSYENWELLLIDDGSKDQSGEICDEYALKDDRIQIFHKRNGGICDARNYGIDRAQGDFITFCDHDDEYTPDLLKVAINEIVKYPECAFVGYGYSTISDDGFCVNYSADNYCKSNLIKVSDCYIELYENHCFNTVWAKLYRASFIKTNQLYFDISYKFGGEDIDFNTKVAKLNPSVLFIPQILYKHFWRKQLSTSASVHVENHPLFIKQIRDVNEVIKILDIDIQKSFISYLRIYCMLFHLHVSYLSLANQSFFYNVKKCEEFGKEDQYRKSFKWKLFAEIYKINKVDSLVYILHKAKAYSVLYLLFYVLGKEYKK